MKENFIVKTLTMDEQLKCTLIVMMGDRVLGMFHTKPRIMRVLTSIALGSLISLSHQFKVHTSCGASVEPIRTYRQLFGT